MVYGDPHDEGERRVIVGKDPKKELEYLLGPNYDTRPGSPAYKFLRKTWAKDDWAGNPFFKVLGKIFHFLKWPIYIIGGMFIFGFFWSFGPFGWLLIGALIWLIIRFRWAVADSSG